MNGEFPPVVEVPIGLPEAGTRTEFDSLGEVSVPADHYWGAQTQRCLDNFMISTEHMPLEVIHAYGIIKRAAALTNAEFGLMPQPMADLIAKVSDEVTHGALDSEFPLLIWQSGSGTQTNMNVNEVIANRAIQLVSGQLGSQQPVAPNQHVNMSQSTNDTFVTAMHIAAYTQIASSTIPKVAELRDECTAKAVQWRDDVKIGRTHLQDATPLTAGQEWSALAASLTAAIEDVQRASDGLLELAVGGTAVGTGLNAPQGFGAAVCERIATQTGAGYRPATNAFAAQSTLEALVRAHASLKSLAVVLFKIANDLRWLGSGPHTGLMELKFPANEPGSSIMPGKVNPTQAEAMLMICTQVMGADVTVAAAGAEGNLQLNAFRPVVIDAVLRSARTLGDGAQMLSQHMVKGADLNRVTIAHNVDRSVMLVTALAPRIGYHEAAAIAHYAVEHDVTLREAALANGVSAELFDEVVKPIDMT